MSNPAPNNPGNDFGKDDEALNRPDENKNEASARRDFLKQAGRTGVGAGLASFLLVGGPVKKALAAADNCVYPYDESKGEDVCEPTADPATTNPDVCDPIDGTKGDLCPAPSQYDRDVCVIRSSSPVVEAGDLCQDSAQLPDECQLSGSDQCEIDYDVPGL